MAAFPLTPKGWNSQPQYPVGINRSHPLASRLLVLTMPGIDGGKTNLGSFAATSVGKTALAQGVFGDFGAASNIALPAGVIPNSRFTVISGNIVATGADGGNSFNVLLGSNYDGTNEPFSIRVNSSSQLQVTTYQPDASIFITPPTGIYGTVFGLIGAVGVAETWQVGHINAAGFETSASGTITGVARATSPHWVGAGGNAGAPYRGWSRPILWQAVISGWLTQAERASLAANPWQLYAPSTRRVFPTNTNIGFGATGSSGDIAASSTFSGAVSWNGVNRLLAVDVSLLGMGVTVTGMTYGGVACTLVGAISTATAAGRVEQWIIKQSDAGAPAAGSNTLAVTLSGSLEFVVNWASYNSVNQTTPIEGFNTAQATNAGTATDASVAITSTTSQAWIRAAVVANKTGITPGQRSRNNISGTLGSGANEDIGPVLPSTSTMNYSNMGITTTWAMAGYALKPFSATTGPTTVTATPGAYSWASPTATIPTQISAGLGAYSWAGTTSSVPIQINSSAGAYTWQGTASAVPTQVQAAPGAYSWAGTTSTFPTSAISATPGAYSWAGTTSSVPAQVQSTPGAYTWTGTTSAVPTQINSTTGAYTWSGTTSAVPTQINASSGSYSWAGISATTGGGIAATPGAYTWTGTTAGVLSPLSATPGAYTWTGTTSSVPAQLSATPGAYTWAATTAAIPVSIAATPGSYNWVGTTSSMLANINASPASYTWAGKTASVVVVSSGKSHTNLYLRQSLIEYYEKAFEKQGPVAVTKALEKVKVPSAKRVSGKKVKFTDDEIQLQRVDKLILQAETALANKPDIVVPQLLSSALKFSPLVTDFEVFANQYRKRQQEDSDLFLFSLVL